MSNQKYVFIGRDLNFTTGDYEIWGPSTQKDRLSKFFIQKLDEVGLFTTFNPSDTALLGGTFDQGMRAWQKGLANSFGQRFFFEDPYTQGTG